VHSTSFCLICLKSDYGKCPNIRGCLDEVLHSRLRLYFVPESGRGWWNNTKTDVTELIPNYVNFNLT
jgi:hypothetical protein